MLPTELQELVFLHFDPVLLLKAFSNLSIVNNQVFWKRYIEHYGLGHDKNNQMRTKQKLVMKQYTRMLGTLGLINGYGRTMRIQCIHLPRASTIRKSKLRFPYFAL